MYDGPDMRVRAWYGTTSTHRSQRVRIYLPNYWAHTIGLKTGMSGKLICFAPSEIDNKDKS